MHRTKPRRSVGARELGKAREERERRRGMSARLPGGDLGGDVRATVVLFGSVEVVGPAAKGEVRRAFNLS
jgi:hypothetical protein